MPTPREPGPDLFAAPQSGRKAEAPLAERMRPREFADYVGQEEITGSDRPLRKAIESDRLSSVIFWGPPGSGKTTLAHLIARHTKAHFVAFSAVTGGIPELREIIKAAEHRLALQQQKTVLFVDEIHRFNKAQQDAFLPFVEQGLFTFIGATTENPSFEVNSALLSRAAVYVLHGLQADELAQLVQRALDQVASLPSGATLQMPQAARELVIGLADGDARRLLNLMEILNTAARAAGIEVIDAAFVQNALARNLRRFDKGGDAFYDQISALHKSVRGSDPDAALYWLVRMLDGGADARYLGRRLLRMASEDIGLADPRALRITLDACDTYERLGSPEGELALAQATLYLACAAKSNAVYVAYNSARSAVANDSSRAVPEHLRNAPTRLMKELGYGKTYRYAHDEPHAYAAGERYLPDGMHPPGWYKPTDRKSTR